MVRGYFVLFCEISLDRSVREKVTVREARMKILGHFLLVGWVGLFGIVALCFVFPESMGHVLAPIANFFVLIPVSLLVGTTLYGVIRLYRAGMKLTPR